MTFYIHAVAVRKFDSWRVWDVQTADEAAYGVSSFYETLKLFSVSFLYPMNRSVTSDVEALGSYCCPQLHQEARPGRTPRQNTTFRQAEIPVFGRLSKYGKGFNGTPACL